MTLLIGAATLAACGGGNGIVRRINPPVASVQALSVNADGSVAIELRIQNFSTVPMRFLRVEASLRVAGSDAGRLALAPNIEIPGQSADVVTATLPQVPPAVRTQLDAGRGIGYRLDGTIATEDPDKDFPFTFDSRLSPVPGRPGAFR